MKLRYTDTATLELDESISNFLKKAPAVAADFADSLDHAIAELLENPYSAQETEKAGVRRKYIRRFRYSVFYTVEGDNLVILHIRHAARRWPWEGDDKPS